MGVSRATFGFPRRRARGGRSMLRLLRGASAGCRAGARGRPEQRATRRAVWVLLEFQDQWRAASGIGGA
eukprot:4118032-Lingulodinium_polyedra.AAC.1